MTDLGLQLETEVLDLFRWCTKNRKVNLVINHGWSQFLFLNYPMLKSEQKDNHKCHLLCKMFVLRLQGDSLISKAAADYRWYLLICHQNKFIIFILVSIRYNLRNSIKLSYFCVCVCSANGSESKKQRLDELPPSRVLHIRKLPNEVTETEVIALGLPFGKVTNILMLKGKNQVNTYPIIKTRQGQGCKTLLKNSRI